VNTIGAFRPGDALTTTPETLRLMIDVNLDPRQQYMADIAASVRTKLPTLDPTPYFQKYGQNVWAAFKSSLDEIARTAAAPVIEKYTGVLAAADVFTESTTFQVMQSIPLDLGDGFYLHP